MDECKLCKLKAWTRHMQSKKYYVWFIALYSYRQSVKITSSVLMLFWKMRGGVVVPAGRALAAPSDSIHAQTHGAITVCRDRLRGVGEPTIGAATVAPQVLPTRL